MKNYFFRIKLLLFCLISISSPIFAPLVVGKEENALQLDCNRLITICQRTEDELARYEELYKTFHASVLKKNGRLTDLNRAHVWAKSVLYRIRELIEHTHRAYIHCSCTASTLTMTDSLQLLLKQAKLEFLRLEKKLKTFEKSVLGLKAQTKQRLR